MLQHALPIIAVFTAASLAPGSASGLCISCPKSDLPAFFPHGDRLADFFLPKPEHESFLNSLFPNLKAALAHNGLRRQRPSRQ